MKRTSSVMAVIALIGQLAHATCEFYEQRPTVFQEYGEVMSEGQKMINDRKFKLDTLLTTNKDTAVSGAWNLGVFSVKSPSYEQLLALKLSDPDPLDYVPPRQTARLKQYVAVHKLLGDLYVVPQLRAILSGEDSERLLRKRGFKTALFGRWGDELKAMLSGPRWIGIAMDQLTDPHPLSRAAATPPFFTSWCEAHVTRALQEMVEIRRRVMMAGIHLFDQQVVVDPYAHVHLIDVDAYYFDESLSATTSLLKEAEELVGRWEKATGQIYNASLKSALFAELNVSHPVCVRPIIVEKIEWRDQKPIECPNKTEEVSELSSVEDTTQDLALEKWPALQRSYRNLSLGQKLAWFASAAGAGVIARTALARGFLLVALIVPTSVNAQEVKGYYNSLEGLDYLLRQKDQRFAEFVIRTNPEFAEFVVKFAQSLHP